MRVSNIVGMECHLSGFEFHQSAVYMCVCVCVCARAFVCVCVCVCVLRR